MAYDSYLSTDKAIGVETLVETAAGVCGTRYFVTNTQEAYPSLFLCPGVPRKGDSWAPELPLCGVVEREHKYWGGQDDSRGVPPTGGRSIVRVRYETPGFRGGNPPPRPGLAFTRLRPVVSTITAMTDINSPLLLINRGDGAPKKVGGVVADVYVYLAPGQTIPLPRLVGLMQKQAVCDGPVSLPPLEDGGERILLGTGEAQYESFDYSLKDGVLELVHHLVLQEDFAYYWTVTDKNNAPEAVGTADIYETASFDGLFP